MRLRAHDCGSFRLPPELDKSHTASPTHPNSPCLFGAIMYPLTGLQMNTARFLKFLGILIVESYAAAGFGMVRGCSSLETAGVGACTSQNQSRSLIHPSIFIQSQLGGRRARPQH